MVPTSTAEVKLQYEKLIIVFCFCQREHITCSLHQTPNSETTISDNSKSAFLLKSGADFNSRRKTAMVRKKK
jgi:hypothetical protein